MTSTKGSSEDIQSFLGVSEPLYRLWQPVKLCYEEDGQVFTEYGVVTGLMFTPPNSYVVSWVYQVTWYRTERNNWLEFPHTDEAYEQDLLPDKQPNIDWEVLRSYPKVCDS